MKENSYYDKHFKGIRVPDLSVGFNKGPRKNPTDLQKIPDSDPRSSQIRKLPTGTKKESTDKKWSFF
jgi:hypothetical protein